MSPAEARAAVGTVATLALGTLRVDVRIVDVREVFGRVDFLLAPVAGSGEVWKAEHNVKIEKGGEK